ncbi:MAG: N-acetyltransferase [Chloroflexi bacterium]|nr:MAG: N-acetyltransferase [Chloroflexota bacterium]
MPVTVRSETEADYEAIWQVNELAFGRTAEAKLVTRLREQGAVAISLVAEQDDTIVGHILFSPVQIENPRYRGTAVALGPLAVTPPRQKQGIGSALVKTGLHHCISQGFHTVVVLGHPTYYPRFGFQPAHQLGLHCEYNVPPEIFMALSLSPNPQTKISGLVRYHPAFQAT